MKLFDKFKSGIGNLFDKIKSKFTNVTQKYEYDCGPASVAMILSFYGKRIKREELVKILRTSENDGTDWLNIEEYFLGLKNFELRQQQMNIESARKYIERGFPLFICWAIDYKYSHYSVLLTLDKPEITMLDPYDVKKFTKYEYEYFIKCWEKENCWYAVLIPENKNILDTKKIEQFSN